MHQAIYTKKTNRIYHISAQTKSILPISRFSLININGMKGMMDTTRTLSKQIPSQEQLNKARGFPLSLLNSIIHFKQLLIPAQANLKTTLENVLNNPDDVLRFMRS